MAELIQLPDGRVCDCGVGDFDPVAHALNCPAKTTPEDLAEFFPPNEPSEAEARQYESTAYHITQRIDALSDKQDGQMSELDAPTIDVPFPEGLVEEKKRQMRKADRFEGSELTGLQYDEVNLPILPSSDGSPEQEAALKIAIEDRNRMLAHGVRASSIEAVKNSPDTRVISGVGMIGGESVVVTKINQNQIWGLGYDVENEGRELAKAVGMTAEDGSVPEKTLEEEGIRTEHAVGKSGIAEELRRWSLRR